MYENLCSSHMPSFEGGWKIPKGTSPGSDTLNKINDVWYSLCCKKHFWQSCYDFCERKELTDKTGVIQIKEGEEVELTKDEVEKKLISISKMYTQMIRVGNSLGLELSINEETGWSYWVDGIL